MCDDHCSCSLDELVQCNGLCCSNDVSSWNSCTRTLRSRQDMMIIANQLVQLLVLDSTVQMVPGIVRLVQYSVDDSTSCTRLGAVYACERCDSASPAATANAIAWPR